MSFRTHVRNLNGLILLVIKISPYGRNDKIGNYDTVSWLRGKMDGFLYLHQAKGGIVGSCPCYWEKNSEERIQPVKLNKIK